MKVHLSLALVLTIASLAVGAAQPPLDTPLIDGFLVRLLEKNKGMGSLALAQDGRLLYSRAHGHRQIAATGNQPATESTRYRIASVTKTYTAVMVFQLIDEGKLKLTDRLATFFPTIPNAERITIGQMLAHRSGIHDFEADGAFGRQARSREEILARIAAGAPDFEPDAAYRYSNAGYVLLGFVVEIAGGTPYGEALQERIAARLGLANTYIGTGTSDPARNESLSYRYLGGWQQATEIDPSVVAGAGGILSTPVDMVKFIQGLFDLKLVSRGSLELMTTMRDGEGMGLHSFTFAGKTFFGHTGGGASSGAWLAYLPEERLALAYASNAKIYPVQQIVGGVLDVYWNRPFQVPSLESLAVSPEILDRYVGVYSIPGAPMRMRFSRIGQTLYVQPGTEEPVPLEAVAENRFRIDPGVFFEFDAATGRMTLDRAGVARTLTKEN